MLRQIVRKRVVLQSKYKLSRRALPVLLRTFATTADSPLFSTEVSEGVERTIDYTLPGMMPAPPRNSVPVVHDISDFGDDLEDNLIGKSLSPVERARLGALATTTSSIRPNMLKDVHVYILRDHLAAKAYPELDSILDPVKHAGARVTVLDSFQGVKKTAAKKKATTVKIPIEPSETQDDAVTRSSTTPPATEQQSAGPSESAALLESAVRAVFAQAAVAATATATTGSATAASSATATRKSTTSAGAAASSPKLPSAAVIVLAPSLSREAFESFQASLELEAEVAAAPAQDLVQQQGQQQQQQQPPSASSQALVDLEDNEREARRDQCLSASLKLGHLPVLNLVSAEGKPLHALAMLKTLRDRRGSVEGAKIAFIGSSTRALPQELVRASTMLGITLALSGPKSTLVTQATVANLVKQAQARCISNAFGLLEITADAFEACDGANVLVTDTIIAHTRDDGRKSHPLTKTMEPYELDQDMAERAAPGFFLLHDTTAAFSEKTAPKPLTDPRCAYKEQLRNQGVALVETLRWMIDQSTVVGQQQNNTHS